MACTNMSCLTSQEQLDGDCGYLAANLHAKSIFGPPLLDETLLTSPFTIIMIGEDALANLCIELTPENTITGHIRIRSKTQGLFSSVFLLIIRTSVS